MKNINESEKPKVKAIKIPKEQFKNLSPNSDGNKKRKTFNVPGREIVYEFEEDVSKLSEIEIEKLIKEKKCKIVWEVSGS